MPTRYLTTLVFEWTRQGRRRPERTCTCAAVTWPRRVGTVPGCYADLLCHHGRPMYGHPDFTGRCPQCDRQEYADILFDRWRNERTR